MADDMGFSDIGCYGSEIATPNLDRLARGGLRFTHFANNARCCPTRASLLSGLYPHQAGVGHMVEDRSAKMGPAYQGYLNGSCVTIGEALGRAGYRTLMAGKWHIGEQPGHWPCDRGFDRYFGLISGASNYFRRDPNRTMASGNEPYDPPAEGFYMTDAFTDAALGFVDEAALGDSPFFLYLAYTAPHWPLHAHPEDIVKHEGRYDEGWDALRAERHARQIEMGIVDPEWKLTPRDTRAPAWGDAPNKEWFARRMEVHAAQIDRLDWNIGRVVGNLRRLGIERDTLVMFLADNGGCAEELGTNDPTVMPGSADTFQSYGLPWANASNTPFRRYKHWVHEGGISTPFIANWPGTIRPGTTTTQFGHVIDLMATCVDVAGARYPTESHGHAITPLEGKSLLPIFRGREREGHDVVFWEHEGNRGVLAGRWKLVSQHPGEWELFDMEADRTEMNDLAQRQPARVREFSDLWDKWASRCGVVMP
jgi:arylsulfatase